MKKVGLVVEDKHTEAIKEISKKLSIKPIIRRQRGRINVRKASAFANELLRSCEKVIILGDADCNEEGEQKRLQEIYKSLPEGLRECSYLHYCPRIGILASRRRKCNFKSLREKCETGRES